MKFETTMIERGLTILAKKRTSACVSYWSRLHRVNLDHIELAVLAVPVKDALHARPPTPLHTPPARSRTAHADLCHPRDVNVRPIDPRVPSPRAPCLLRFDARVVAVGRTARTVRRRPPYIPLTHEPAAAARPTLAFVPTAAAINLMVTECDAFLLLPAGLAPRRRRRVRPLAGVRRGCRIQLGRRPVEGNAGPVAPRM